MKTKSDLFRPAFTMIELLVILGILVFVLGMLFPAIRQVQRAASRTQSINNLRQLALAMHNINDVYKKTPPVVGSFPNKDKKAGTLFFHILPYIEQQNVYQKADGDVTKNETYGVIIPIYLNHKDTSAPPANRYKGWLATTSYAANWMAFGNTAGGTASLPASFPDGTYIPGKTPYPYERQEVPRISARHIGELHVCRGFLTDLFLVPGFQLATTLPKWRIEDQTPTSNLQAGFSRAVL